MIYYPADQTEDKSQVVQQTFLISTSSRFVKVQQTLESSNYSRNKVYICLKLDCMFFFCYFIRIFQEHVLCSPLSKMLVPRRVTCLYRQQPWHNTERVRDFCTAHTRLLIYKHEASHYTKSKHRPSEFKLGKCNFASKLSWTGGLNSTQRSTYWRFRSDMSNSWFHPVIKIHKPRKNF